MTLDQVLPSGAETLPLRALPLRALLHRRLVFAVVTLSVMTAVMLGLSAVLLAWLAPEVNRSDAVLGALQDGHVAMLDQETGLRGFLVTRDQRFLQPYREGDARRAALDAELTGWARQDPELAGAVHGLWVAEDRWSRQWAVPVLQQQPRLGDSDALSALLLDGKALFDSYRQVETRVRGLLQHRRDVAVARERVALLVGVALVVATVAVSALGVRRSDRRMTAQLVPPTYGLRDTLRALAAGDVTRRAAPSGPAEFHGIAADINALGGALQLRNELVAARERDLVAARDEAEKAGHAKTAFLATMSHEIRTPLNAVLGLTDMLLTTDLDDEQRSHLETIAGSGDALLALINDVLDFSKLEAGELDLDLALFDLADLVYDVAQLLAGQAAGKGLDLLVDVPVDPALHVVGDGPRLRQVVMNLVGNALKFTAHGVVVVRVRAERCGDRLACRIAVSDTGIGIPDDRRHRLFRSFSQVDASTTRSYGGTGLGLAISQRIARAMGGDITVDSEPGVGSTFTVSVDLAVPDTVPVRTAGDALAGARLLVVDDNPTNLTILGHQLSRYGAQCVLAAGGPPALEAVAADARFDAVVLDLHMPGMTGDELAARLRERPDTAGLPLVLLSSSTVLDRDVLSHFAARLHKPVRPERLLRTVQSVLRRGGAVPPEVTLSGPEPTEGRERLRVLVAEDNAVNARLMELYLRELGHDSEHVPDGAQAVGAVLGGRFDVVLMDAQMPVLGGVDATAAIRLMPGPQPRIIAVTASVLDSDRTAFLEAGADDFVTKPVRLATLDQALACWADAEQVGLPDLPAACPAADATDVLDAETVEELRDLGDEGFTHLYRQYLATLDETVTAILAAADAPPPGRDDDGSVHRLAHRLKGSSAAMGAARMADICRDLELAGADDGTVPSPGELDAALRTLREEGRRVRAAVTTLLDAR